MVQGYFESGEWPYQENSKIKGNHFFKRPPVETKLTCVIDPGFKTWGCILWILAALISFGIAIIVWLFWALEREDFLPYVVVTAIPEGPGVSTVTVTSQKQGK